MPPADSQEQQASVAQRYHALLDIGRKLAGTLSLEELYAAIHRETAQVLEASGFSISLYDQSRDLATVVYFAERNQVKPLHATYRGTDSDALRTGRPVQASGKDAAMPHLVAQDESGASPRSCIAAPMVLKGKTLGSIGAHTHEEDAYTQDDLDLLQGIADMAGVAVDNALHVAQLEKRTREAERVEEIGRALASSLDPAVVLGKVVQAVNDTLEADGSSVWMCDTPGGDTFKVVASAGEIALPEGIEWNLEGPVAERLIDKTEPLVIDDLTVSPMVPQHLREHLEGGSGVGVPLVLNDQVAGALSAGSRRPQAFTEDDVKVLQRLASQASVALENARLHEHLQALSLTDALTELPNRRHLEIHLDKEVAAARRGRRLVLVVFDLDDFKMYNDTHGHVVGDQILRAFGIILHEENRAMNLVARYGGDEFVSILSETHMEGAHHYVERVANRVAQDEVLARYGVTVSIGLAEFDRASMQSVDDVLEAADADMYRVKSTYHDGRQAASS